jgi:hypothetical protein
VDEKLKRKNYFLRKIMVIIIIIIKKEKQTGKMIEYLLGLERRRR